MYSTHFSVTTIPETQIDVKPKIKTEPTGIGPGTDDAPIKTEDDEGFTYLMNRKTRRQVVKELGENGRTCPVTLQTW